MTLKETTQAIGKWIKSCDTSDQLNLCEELIKDYVVKRYEKTVDMIDMAHAESYLKMQIQDMRLILAARS